MIVVLFCLVLLNSMLVKAEDFYSFNVEANNKDEISLEYFRGKVSLVVNVASQCEYTDSTFKALTRLHDILSYGGYFNVLAFPCNQFGESEPDTINVIFHEVLTKYELQFPIFNKIDVIGPNSNPAFKYLIDKSMVEPDWNFYKYLVDENGEVINVWDTKITIEEIFDDIQIAIEKAMQRNLTKIPYNKDEL